MRRKVDTNSWIVCDTGPGQQLVGGAAQRPVGLAVEVAHAGQRGRRGAGSSWDAAAGCIDVAQVGAQAAVDGGRAADADGGGEVDVRADADTTRTMSAGCSPLLGAGRCAGLGRRYP